MSSRKHHHIHSLYSHASKIQHSKSPIKILSYAGANFVPIAVRKLLLVPINGKCSYQTWKKLFSRINLAKANKSRIHKFAFSIASPHEVCGGTNQPHLSYIWWHLLESFQQLIFARDALCQKLLKRYSEPVAEYGNLKTPKYLLLPYHN